MEYIVEIKKCIEHTCKVRYGTSVYRKGHAEEIIMLMALFSSPMFNIYFISYNIMQKRKDHEAYHICFRRVINTSLSIS